MTGRGRDDLDVLEAHLTSQDLKLPGINEIRIQTSNIFKYRRGRLSATNKNEKKRQSAMLNRYPRRVNDKRLISKQKGQRKICIYKSHGIIKNYKGK